MAAFAKKRKRLYRTTRPLVGLRRRVAPAGGLSDPQSPAPSTDTRAVPLPRRRGGAAAAAFGIEGTGVLILERASAATSRARRRHSATNFSLSMIGEDPGAFLPGFVGTRGHDHWFGPLRDGYRWGCQMVIDLDSWEVGYADGQLSRPSRCPADFDQFSYSSGYVQGHAAPREASRLPYAVNHRSVVVAPPRSVRGAGGTFSSGRACLNERTAAFCSTSTIDANGCRRVCVGDLIDRFDLSFPRAANQKCETG
jgi:hypothetical protein